MLRIIRTMLEEDTYNEVMEYSWSTMWNVTGMLSDQGRLHKRRRLRKRKHLFSKVNVQQSKCNLILEKNPFVVAIFLLENRIYVTKFTKPGKCL